MLIRIEVWKSEFENYLKKKITQYFSSQNKNKTNAVSLSSLFLCISYSAVTLETYNGRLAKMTCKLTEIFNTIDNGEKNHNVTVNVHKNMSLYLSMKFSISQHKILYISACNLF